MIFLRYSLSWRAGLTAGFYSAIDEHGQHDDKIICVLHEKNEGLYFVVSAIA